MLFFVTTQYCSLRGHSARGTDDSLTHTPAHERTQLERQPASWPTTGDARVRHRPSEEDVVMKWQLEARLMNWNGLAGQFWSRYSSGTDLGESWILTVTTKQAAVTCFAGRKVLFCSVPFWGHEVSLRCHCELLTENSFEHLQVEIYGTISSYSF